MGDQAISVVRRYRGCSHRATVTRFLFIIRTITFPLIYGRSAVALRQETLTLSFGATRATRKLYFVYVLTFTLINNGDRVGALGQRWPLNLSC